MESITSATTFQHAQQLIFTKELFLARANIHDFWAATCGLWELHLSSLLLTDINPT